MWIKYSMPRIRIDHMLAFNWKFLTPLALVLLVTTAVLSKILSTLPAWEYAAGMFASNMVIGLITVEFLRKYGRKQRNGSNNNTSSNVQNQEQVV
jgi:NADH-quinone oxidoreductase subunit H